MPEGASATPESRVQVATVASAAPHPLRHVGANGHLALGALAICGQILRRATAVSDTSAPRMMAEIAVAPKRGKSVFVGHEAALEPAHPLKPMCPSCATLSPGKRYLRGRSQNDALCHCVRAAPTTGRRQPPSPLAAGSRAPLAKGTRRRSSRPFAIIVLSQKGYGWLWLCVCASMQNAPFPATTTGQINACTSVHPETCAAHPHLELVYDQTDQDRHGIRNIELPSF